jgi:hypothetical protein
VVVVAKQAYVRLAEWAAPDPEKMRQQFEKLQAANPTLSRDALVRKIIGGQSLRAGIVGAVTGLGGFITLPITLPIDLYASFRIQATMVDFIGYAYDKPPGELEKRIMSYLIAAGSEQATAASIKYSTRIAARVLGKTLSKLIPFVGALTSFVVNYLLTQAMGRAAVERFTRI